MKYLKLSLITLIIFISLLLVTTPASVVIRLVVPENIKQKVEFSNITGYLFKGSASAHQLNNNSTIKIQWSGCFVAAFPYLGWCFRADEENNYISGKLTTLDGQNLKIKEITGEISSKWLLQQHPILQIAHILNLKSLILINIQELNLSVNELIIKSWQGNIIISKITFASLDLGEISIQLKNSTLARDKQLALGTIDVADEVPQFIADGGTNDIRIRLNGLITADRKYSLQLNIDSRNELIQNTLNNIIAPQTKGKYIWEYQGAY